jgi:hypothetical protein
VRRSVVRDVIDFLDYDIEPEVWIRRLVAQLASGRYEPKSPDRFPLAKSSGLSRQMTQPAIPDVVLYRAVADSLYRGAKRREHKHVYFLRRQAADASRTAATEAAAAMSSYPSGSRSRFLTWLRYDQYRKYLILKRVYPYIVVTDISNFFDSILFNRVVDSVLGRFAQPRMVGLLLFLLERLSIREAFSESPRIGLPVDEHDCSRKLAHMVLFPHDDRMTALVGEDAYVRWMDDQNIGVRSRAHGLTILSQVGTSLARLHLTPNTSKTKLLSLSEARRHFHLDLNKLLDAVDKMPNTTKRQRVLVGRELRRVWSLAKLHEGKGEWEKILKRIYLVSGLAGSRLLRRLALPHLLKYPTSAARIADYVRWTGTAPEYLRFVRLAWGHDEQIHEDVNLILAEGLLRLEAFGVDAREATKIGQSLLQQKGQPEVGRLLCRPLGPLVLLRFGGRRSLRTLRRILVSGETLPERVMRAVSVVYAGQGLSEFRDVRRITARLWSHRLAQVVRLVERIRTYSQIPDRFKLRYQLAFDSSTGLRFVDIRHLVAIRLLYLNDSVSVRRWLKTERQKLLANTLSQFDRRIVRRLLPR